MRNAVAKGEKPNVGHGALKVFSKEGHFTLWTVKPGIQPPPFNREKTNSTNNTNIVTIKPKFMCEVSALHSCIKYLILLKI